MTLSEVRDFFRSNLKQLGLKEWNEAFVIENIPSTLLDRSYHLGIGHIVIRNVGPSGNCFEVQYPVVLRVLSKGYRHTGEALDAAIGTAQDILELIVGAVDRLDQKGLKHVHPTAIDTQPLQTSNEHAVILSMSFNAVLYLGF